MPASENRFKTAIHQGKPQIGLWLDMGEAITAEIAGTAGFDWLVIDGEHGPNDLRSIIDQLRALATSSAEPVVRVPVGESWIIKQMLDAGARTLLVPMVDSSEQARALVSAMHYPPRGIRGMGAVVARASGYNSVPDYNQTASDNVCLLIQAETRAAIADLDNILNVDGVNGIFIGPADLAADMGYLGRIDEPEVQEVIEGAIRKIVAAGKAAGILTFNEIYNRRYLELGASFVAVGADVSEFSGALRQLASRYKGGAAPAKTSSY
ncbi:aldolase/citrate lyase family protein [Agrobacterium larrymoorei]|uniref:HpcH/HpaI aldolase/citrate lyase family protein n=1 Tax=Agrobacterium larrymoorei TaxID=160699 RepID=A0AAF0H9H5_9HYPH|nr:HpcH/HpaI aldolase/citrate lyase family protein [Agrobacterium larrymoorei]WHA40344.1 HpcH/HpaI aldolase/citrate lyase family protein [Agrobacterium larrymoorei]